MISTKLFYPELFIFLALSLVASCAHSPKAPFDAVPEPGTYSEQDWMSGDDQADYVRRESRRPTDQKTVKKYKISGSCGGFPRVDLKTARGFCVGLVYDGSAVMKKLRWATVLDQNQFLLVDMGGWGANSGRIYKATIATNGTTKVEQVLGPQDFPNKADPRAAILDRPNQMSWGPDGRVWVGSVSGLYSFDPRAAKLASSVRVLVDKIPAAGLHPLKTFTWDDQGFVYVNVGSASNVCQNFTQFGEKDPAKNPRNPRVQNFPNCPEVEALDIGQAQIRRYPIKSDGALGPEFEVFAKGLRNSIGLIWDDQRKVLIQAENGRDAINKFSDLKNADFPHEELNILRAKSHYGWPYCYDNNLNNPEWKHMDCSGYTKPQILLPPHSAPLALLIYKGKMFPEWYSQRLLAAFHGYEPKGHRIVAFKRDEQGLPSGVPQSLVYDWEERGEQGKGKPVSLAEMPDGSLLIVEDDNQNKVLRLFFDPREGSGQPVQEIDQNPVREEDPLGAAAEEARKNRLEDKLRGGNNSPFVLFQAKVIDKTCYECHQAAGSPGVQLLRYDDEGNEKRIRQSGKVKDFLRVIESDGSKGMQMPPQGWDSSTQQDEAVRLLKAWIQKLPK